MELALETQLVNGPLADLTAGNVNGNGFVSEVQSLESSYEQGLDQQLSPEFPHVDEILKLQGQAIVADVISLNQQEAVGLISSSELAADAQAAIVSPTNGPIGDFNTSSHGYTSTTQTFESNIAALAQSLGSSASPSLTPAKVSATALTETEAYQVDLHAGLQVLHPNVSNNVDTAVNALESVESGIAQDAASAAQTQLTSALTAFNSAMLGSGGLFVSSGAVSQAIAHNAFNPNMTEPQFGTVISNVSGTAAPGGPATLVATLTSPGTGGRPGRNGELHSRRGLRRDRDDQ